MDVSPVLVDYQFVLLQVLGGELEEVGEAAGEELLDLFWAAVEHSGCSCLQKGGDLFCVVSDEWY